MDLLLCGSFLNAQLLECITSYNQGTSNVYLIDLSKHPNFINVGMVLSTEMKSVIVVGGMNAKIRAVIPSPARLEHTRNVLLIMFVAIDVNYWKLAIYVDQPDLSVTFQKRVMEWVETAPPMDI